MQYYTNKRLNNAHANMMAAIAIGAMLVFSVAGTKAFADNVQDDVVVGGNDTITAGGSTTVKYRITANNGDGQTGCNAADGSKATVTINAPSGVTATPGSLVFASCGTGTDQSVQFSSSTVGSHDITVSVSDSGVGGYNTNPAEFTLVVNAAEEPANTPPSITVPSDISVPATSASGASVDFEVTANDEEDGDLTDAVDCSHASGSTFPIGTTTVECTVEDSGGLSDSGSFTVTVTAPRDTAAPELSLPNDITEEATGPDGAEVTYTATATDAVDGEVEITCTPASGSIFPLATTTVNCSAEDAAENEATGSFTVTVRDTTPPVVSTPADQAVEATGPDGAEVTYTATATDVVDGSITPTCTPASGSIFPLATTTVNCEATDAAGNTGSKTFSVKVQDTIAPVIQVDSTISDGQQFYFGNVPSAPTCTATDSGSGVNSDGCKVAGHATTVGPQTLTFTATDNAGNIATQTIKYTVLPWTLKGFYQPVDMDTSSTIVINTVKGGSVVPLKLEIFQGTTELTSTTFNNNPVGSFAPKKVSCTPGSTEDAIETLATPGSTAFRYDSTAGQFIYNWQTPKQPNACYDVIFTSLDGTTLTAHFKLK